MDHRVPATRRDRRFPIRPGSTVRFAGSPADGESRIGELTVLSVAGVAFRVPGQPDDFPPYSTFADVTVTLGRCVVQGSAVVRNAHPIESDAVELGCLFFPGATDEDRWMTLISGIEAAVAPEEDPR